MNKNTFILPVVLVSTVIIVLFTGLYPDENFTRSAIFIYSLNIALWAIILARSFKYYFSYQKRRQKGGACFIYLTLAIASAALVITNIYDLLSTSSNTHSILATEGFFSKPIPWLFSHLSTAIGGLGIIYLFVRGSIEKIAIQSTTDELTQIPNRRYMKDLFQRELSRTARHKIPLSCAMIDIDHFKKFNDTYGHQVGDLVLQKVARLMENGKRAYDVVARYGGEEFIWLLINSVHTDSYQACERLRREISAAPFEFMEEKVSITVSIGVASFDGNGDCTATALVRKADMALYEAKRNGRNRTISDEEVGSIEGND